MLVLRGTDGNAFMDRREPALNIFFTAQAPKYRDTICCWVVTEDIFSLDDDNILLQLENYPRWLRM